MQERALIALIFFHITALRVTHSSLIDVTKMIRSRIEDIIPTDNVIFLLCKIYISDDSAVAYFLEPACTTKRLTNWTQWKATGISVAGTNL